MKTLVVVACGDSSTAGHGLATLLGGRRAKDLYTGELFRINRAYAERFGDGWVILSPRHGFLDPETRLRDGQAVRLGEAGSVDMSTLRRQVRELGLDRFPSVSVLATKEFVIAVEAAFADTDVSVKRAVPPDGEDRMAETVRQAVEGDAPLTPPAA